MIFIFSLFIISFFMEPSRCVKQPYCTRANSVWYRGKRLLLANPVLARKLFAKRQGRKIQCHSAMKCVLLRACFLPGFTARCLLLPEETMLYKSRDLTCLPKKTSRGCTLWREINYFVPRCLSLDQRLHKSIPVFEQCEKDLICSRPRHCPFDQSVYAANGKWHFL